MDAESKIQPVLGHLAWLADRIDDPVNDGRLKDAALLTFNAAAMLQWRFMLPVSYADTIRDDDLRTEAAESIDGLVASAEKIVAKAEHADSGQDKALREQLTARIRRVLKTLPRLLLGPPPQPVRMSELEVSPNVRQLMDEFLAAHATEHAAAISKGRAIGVKGGSGPDAALNEALAGLIYVYDNARETDTKPSLRHSLTQMATGFFKTAVDMQPDDELPEQNRLMRRLADSLVAEAGENTSI